MHKSIAIIIVAACAQFALAESATVNGVTWYYSTYSESGRTCAQIISGADKYAGDLTVPATLGGYQVRRIGYIAFDNCSGLSGITLPSGITRIENYAFHNCSGLVKVSFPNTLTYIGWYAFFGCSGLTSVVIPDSVTSIGSDAFEYCSALKSVTLSRNLTSIPSSCFSGCSSLRSIEFPAGLETIGYEAFYNCTPAEIILPASVTTIGEYAFSGGNYTSRRVVFLGAPPSGIANSYLLSSSNVSYPREHGAAWLKILNNINKFNGYNQPGKPEVEYVSVTVRESDPTILDVVYRVKSSRPTVKVRAIAFKDGTRSFANVVRPETWIEGTGVNVGDSIMANAEHKLSWRVSSDWQVKLAKVKFEILAVEEDLLPLELVTIPAKGSNRAMEISWNAITESQVFDALLWLYADKTAGLTLADGELKDGGTTLAKNNSIRSSTYDSWDSVSQTYYWQTYPAPAYVFSKMGFSQLAGDALTYANAMTRLGLRPLGVRQYAYRWIEVR